MHTRATCETDRVRACSQHLRDWRCRRRPRSFSACTRVLCGLVIAACWWGRLPVAVGSSGTCGDGRVVAAANETCDDGNTLDGDGCSKSCTIECGFDCSALWTRIPGASSMSEYGFFNSSCVARHGDGKRLLGEQCDDGNIVAGDGCHCTPASSSDPGGCKLERNWECHPVAELGDSCSSRIAMADACKCDTYLGNVTHPSQPLKALPARSERVTSGFAGASPLVRCGACACDHYGGGCGTENYCNWETTCSGNGFCDGGGKCVCFGNFTGDNCNRCKCDHYGPTCAVYCDPASTCKGHGVCDFNGACMRNPMCDGVDLSAEVCGDGRRLGAEECDDNNTVSGDGCSSACTVEPGFKCVGGCSHTGDARVTYGECRQDSCVALPCGFHLTDMSPNMSEGALFVESPRFLTRRIQHDTPLAKQDNILRITLSVNVPLPRCIRSTRMVDEPVEAREWLRQQREQTRLCERTRITISGLTGVVAHTVKSVDGGGQAAGVDGMNQSSVLEVRDMQHASQPFAALGICYGNTPERTNKGYCDDISTGAKADAAGKGLYTQGAAGGDIVMTVLQDIPARSPLEFLITVRNGPSCNAAPRLRVEASGIEIGAEDMELVPFKAENLQGQPLTLPLEIRSCPTTPGARAEGGDASSDTSATSVRGSQSMRMRAGPQLSSAARGRFPVLSASASLAERWPTSSSLNTNTATSSSTFSQRGHVSDTVSLDHPEASLADRVPALASIAEQGYSSSRAQGGRGGFMGGQTSWPRHPPWVGLPSFGASPSHGSTSIRSLRGGAEGEGGRSQRGLGQSVWKDGETGAGGPWRTRGTCDGFCDGTGLTQADASAGAINIITVQMKLQQRLPAASRITLTGLLPPSTPVLFAVTSSQQCAESLPFGPTDRLLPVSGKGGEEEPYLASAPPGYDPSDLRAHGKTGFGTASGFLSTFNRDSVHLGFLQRLYDNETLQFEILWSFVAGPKSLSERFRAAAAAPEPVVWTIRDANKTEVAVKRGFWRFSKRFSKPSGQTPSFDATTDVAANEGFSYDDGAWGAATGVGSECNVSVDCGHVDGAVSPHYENPIIMNLSNGGGDFWGHGNFNQNSDYDGCTPGAPCCNTYFMGGSGNRHVSDTIRNEMYFVPCRSCHCQDSAGSAGGAAALGTLTGYAEAARPEQANNTCSFVQRQTPDVPVLLQSCGVIPPASGLDDSVNPWYLFLILCACVLSCNVCVCVYGVCMVCIVCALCVEYVCIFTYS